MEVEYLEYRKLKGYRYQISKPATIPIISKQLREALSEVRSVIHPYFEIRSTSVWAKDLYAWDGATGAINTKDLIVPSLIHDIGCQAINNGLLPRTLRKPFDKEYYHQSLMYGVCKERALAHYLIVSAWGKIPKDKENEDYAKKHNIIILSA